MKGFEFDEANFQKALANDDDITTADVMNVFRNLKDDSVKEEDNIFHLKPEQLLEEGGGEE